MGILLPKDVDSIMIVHRAGTAQDPYIDIQQTLKVATNRVILKEVPDETTKVTVSDGTSNLVESTSPKNLTEGTYYVDYRIGFVYFSDADNGKTFDFSFKGTGVLNMPASRIVLEDNQETEKTLQDYIDESDQHIQTANDAIDNMNQVVEETNEAKNNANAQAQHAQTQGDYAKSVGDNVKTNWLAPVVSFTDVTNTYTSPTHGDTVMTTTDSKVYRYQNGQWDHTQTITDSGISDVQAELAEQDQQTANLVHGTQVVQSDQSSPLKVEFYPRTRINYMGREGSFHNQGKWNNNLVIDTSTYKFGTSSGKIDNSAGTKFKNSKNGMEMNIDKDYVIVGVWAKAESGTPTIKVHLQENDSTGSQVSVDTMQKTINSNWNFYYFKVDLSAKTTKDHYKVIVEVYSFGTADDIVYFDGVLAEELTQEQFNAIGVSKTDEDVLREHNYIESVQHVKNPVLFVEGDNLLPPFYEWDLHDNATILSPYEIDNGSGSNVSKHDVDFVENQSYTISNDSSSESGSWITVYDENTSTTIVAVESGQSKTFSVTDSSGVVVRTYGGIVRNPILNLGTSALPFVERNPSYLYFGGKERITGVGM